MLKMTEKRQYTGVRKSNCKQKAKCKRGWERKDGMVIAVMYKLKHKT